MEALTVAVVGLGLIGGSLGMRLRTLGLGTVIGVDREAAVARRARERGAADEATTQIGAVSDAEVVIIAVPLEQIVPVAREAAGHARTGAVLTDVGSVKGPIVAELGSLRTVHYLGGHPMFGSEGQGIQAAAADLPEGFPYVLTPTPTTDRGALGLLEGLIRRLQMQPVILTPEVHDRLVAEVSHLPYLLGRLLDSTVSLEGREIAGPAFRDATRIARSPGALWAEILHQNRSHILPALDHFATRLEEVREDLQRDNVSWLLREN